MLLKGNSYTPRVKFVFALGMTECDRNGDDADEYDVYDGTACSCKKLNPAATRPRVETCVGRNNQLRGNAQYAKKQEPRTRNHATRNGC